MTFIGCGQISMNIAIDPLPSDCNISLDSVIDVSR